MNDSSITIVAADDHKVFIAGIASLFEGIGNIELVAIGYDGHQLLAIIDEYQPDIALIDLSMKGPNTQEIIAYVVKHHPTTKLIALTMYHDPHEAKKLMNAGLAGYVLKESAFEDVTQAVTQVIQGKHFISAPLAQEIEQLPFDDNHLFLTEREKHILTNAAHGSSNKEIANSFGISERTVRFHLANCCEKLNANGRSNAVAIALHRHLIELS